MISFVIFSILPLFWSSIVTKAAPLAKDCLPSKITAITSFRNGTVFIASNQFYWLLNNNTLNPFDSQSSGLIKDLIPGMNSVQMAVSLRHSMDGTANETLFFQTFEDNRNKYMAYRNKKWENGTQLIQEIINLGFNGSLQLNTVHKNRTFLLYFDSDGIPILCVIYGKNGSALWIQKGQNFWLKTDFFKEPLNDMANNMTFDSLWVRKPDNDSLFFKMFSGHQYSTCALRADALSSGDKLCDPNKQNITQLIKCLPPVVSNAKTTTVGTQIVTQSPKRPKEEKKSLNNSQNKGFKQTFIVVVIVTLVVALILLIVVIIVYCRCLRALTALETERGKSDEKSDPKQKPSPNASKPEKDILSEVISDDEKKDQGANAGGTGKTGPKLEMSARVNQMKEILERKKSTNAPQETPQEAPKKTQKEKQKDKKTKITTKQKEKVSDEEGKQQKEPQKRQFAEKGSKKFQKNVQDIGRMISEGAKHEPKKPPITGSKNVSEPIPEIEDKGVESASHRKSDTKKRSKSKAKQTPAPSVVVTQTSDERVRQLMSKSPANDTDRVNQLLSTTSRTSASPVSKQQDSRVEKLLKE